MEKEMAMGGKCFTFCPNLREVVLPKYLKNSGISLFSYCFNLESVTLPDIVEYPEDIKYMFDWCPNIKEFKFSEISHFRKGDDSIIYYDSIPVIFNLCKTKDWVSKDSTISIIDAIVIRRDYNYPINILPLHWQENHYAIDSISGKKITNYIIYQKTSDAIVNIPMIEGGFIYANYNSELKEVHTPFANPNLFSLTILSDEKDVTLFVPYGCKEAYYDSGKYKEYRDIKEDPLIKRVFQTAEYWWNGIKWTFETFSWLLYPIILFVLALLLFVFYKLKVYQMSKRGFILRKKAFLYAIMADIASVIGFIPVYYTIYWLTQNHIQVRRYKICIFMSIILYFFAISVIRLLIDARKKVIWPWLLFIVVIIGCYFVYYVKTCDNYNIQCICLSSFCGGFSGYICAYLAAFAGNGKILGKMKRLRFS